LRVLADFRRDAAFSSAAEVSGGSEELMPIELLGYSDGGRPDDFKTGLEVLA
jgi:hypothetical protein